MPNIDVYEIVIKLVGPIEPVGETRTDEKCFENLKTMTELVERLLHDIADVAVQKERPEFSIKKAGEYAAYMIDEWRNLNEKDN